MKIKKITALIMALTVSCGVIQTVNNYSPVSFTAIAAEQTEQTIFFNEETGSLSLRGNVNNDEVKKYSDKATTVIAEAGTVLPENCTGLFAGFKAVSIDLSKADASNVKYMGYMFGSCENLEELNVSGLDTSNVKNMNYLFRDCKSLKTLDLSDLDTYKVGQMTGMFKGCSAIETIDLSGFNTFYVHNMNEMFKECKKLKTIYAGAGWATDSLEDCRYMFSECDSLKGGNGTLYNKENDFREYARVDEEGKSGYLTASENYAAGLPEDRQSTVVKEGVLSFRVFSDHAELFLCDKDAEGVIIIPEKVNDQPVTVIRRAAFLERGKITSVEMPDTIKEIGYVAFRNCTNLKKIKLSKSLESIGEEAFESVDRIEKIEFPDSLKFIDDSAFENVYFSNELIIPESVEKIGKGAFSGSIDKIVIFSRDCDIADNYEFDNSVRETLRTRWIFGYTASTAEAYAKKYDIPFFDLETIPVWGDANCDNGVDMSDVVIIMQSLANPDKYGVDGTDEHHITEKGLELADVSRPSYERPDGVTTEDALLIQQYLLGKVSSIVPKHE
ncbi:MAG: BspA family leucine-rich repeat surface protein [Ruminococcus sp.]|uniref:BspA family leucine-rich repeat surface protein n=1 Tax=Ruminococcus sp. TaxID=41978 RepID=UPI0025F5EF99|nr:BspA family leucine-rich repeat surface protein [Ruminococcus sp.]MCR5601619.1 BspA family leucine-rich repeat surface protein [Ruminococcus sp.]